MKAWGTAIGIILILAVLCSPVLAISKSDLISQYQTGGSSESTPPTSAPTSHTPSWYITPPPTPVWGPVIPFPTPAPAPTQVPTGTGTLTIYRIAYTVEGGIWREIDHSKDVWGAKVYLDGTLKGYTPLTITGIPIGSHQVKVISSPHFQYRDYVTDVTIVEDEETIVEVYISGAVVTPTPTPSLKELIASLVVKPYSPINCCDDCTPQPWIKGTVTPESIPTPSLEELIAGYQKIEYSSYAATQGIKQCGGPINGIVTPEPVLPY